MKYFTFCIFFLTSLLFADTIVLKSGQQKEGAIITLEKHEFILFENKTGLTQRFEWANIKDYQYDYGTKKSNGFYLGMGLLPGISGLYWSDNIVLGVLMSTIEVTGLVFIGKATLFQTGHGETELFNTLAPITMITGILIDVILSTALGKKYNKKYHDRKVSSIDLYMNIRNNQNFGGLTYLY